MSKQIRAAGVLLALILGLSCAAQAADDVDTLARDVDRLTSLRQVKDLQRSYAHYLQAGLWDEAASVFTDDARFIRGTGTLNGRKAVAAWLLNRGGGRRGLAPGALYMELIDEPLTNLSADGMSARSRWMSLALIGDGKGTSLIEGGIYENEYVRDGQRWKISVAHYYPHYSGNYEKGWSNIGNADLPLVPYHFTLDESGVPLPPPVGAAPAGKTSLAALTATIDRLNDEDDVRNLQHSYGYYVDRRMWDDVVDLFAADSVVEETGAGSFKGQRGVRQYIERMGAAGLQQGQLNDHPIFDTLVQVLPGGREAYSRGLELGLIGDAAKGTQHWEFAVFRNRFVKEDGLWKFRELRRFPVLHADYAQGWGDGGKLKFANDALPAFLAANPATGKAVATKGFKLLAARPLTVAIAADKSAAAAGTETSRLNDARGKLARSMAWDGTENVSSAYGYYIDDFQWPNMGGIFAERGNKQSPFAGYYFGKDRITAAATAMYGNAAPARAGISYHWRVQLVVNVAADGRSTNLRTRLFQPRTGKARDGAPSPAGLFSGMYPNDQAVIERGIWRLWALEIDEPYFTQAGWEGGWSGVKPRAADAPRPAASPLVTRLPPDLLLTKMGKRAEGFRGGTGETIEWPGILPMWFNYRNPVSGRLPEFYWPDCAPCELMPEMQMTKHGYLMPPTGP